MSSRGSNNNATDCGYIYLVDGEEAFDEIERAIGISVMGVDGVGVGVFSFCFEEGERAMGIESFKKQWQCWLRENFKGRLADTFVEVYTASLEMRIRRIVELDKQLDQALSAEERGRSRQAGAWFLEGKSEMQRAPQWQKYARRVEQGECPGHVVVAFALQAALYNLPLLSALTSYVYFEWRAGIKAFGDEGGSLKIEVSPQLFHQEFSESVDIVREVFAGWGQTKLSISAL